MELRDSQISWRRAGDEVIVLDLSGGEYFALNSSAALLWERLAETPRSREQLAEILTQQYGVGADRADTDVDAFVVTLRQHGLVRE